MKQKQVTGSVILVMMVDSHYSFQVAIVDEKGSVTITWVDRTVSNVKPQELYRVDPEVRIVWHASGNCCCCCCCVVVVVAVVIVAVVIVVVLLLLLLLSSLLLLCCCCCVGVGGDGVFALCIYHGYLYRSERALYDLYHIPFIYPSPWIYTSQTH